MQKIIAILGALVVIAGSFLIFGGKTPAFASTGCESGYVQVNPAGTGLCLHGNPYRILGATGYGNYKIPAAQYKLAQKMNLNTYELVNYFCKNSAGQITKATATSACTMNSVDSSFDYFASRGDTIVLNFSQYGTALYNSGFNPCTYDWGPFLQTMANHVSPASGLPYSEETHIAIVELWAEIPAPNYSNNMGCTQANEESFYSRTLAEARADFPGRLIVSGGFSNYNDPNSGIVPVAQAAWADPNNDVCATEINSYQDRDITFPAVLSYCQGLPTPKPIWLSAWSSCHNPSGGSYDINDYQVESDAAAHATQMLGSSYAKAPDVVGSDFWSMGTDSTYWPEGTCQIGDESPLIESAVTNGEG